MYKKEEIDELVAWCDQKKKERNSIRIIERNPFSQKFEWMRNIISIYIDCPLSMVPKTCIAYESTMKKLYKYINGAWMPINALKQ